MVATLVFVTDQRRPPMDAVSTRFKIHTARRWTVGKEVVQSSLGLLPPCLSSFSPCSGSPSASLVHCSA